MLSFELTKANQKKLNILDYEGEIEFTKIKQFKIKFGDIKSTISDFYFLHSQLSILVNVTNGISANGGIDCNKNSNSCGQPIRIYGKLNDIPRPEDVFYDKKDDTGKFSSNNILYGFEYSPCSLNLNDTLNIKIVGIEGKANFTLSVNFNYLSNYKVICPKGDIPPLAIHSAVSSTPYGAFQWGGKINGTLLTDDIYHMSANSENNVTWTKTNTDFNKISPEPRYGHLMTYFQNFLIIFAGKNKEETSLNDLWVYDIITSEWFKIDYLNSRNTPRPKFLPTGEVIKRYGIVLIYGGKEDLNSQDDNNIYVLDLKVLELLIKYQKRILTDEDFDYATKVNHLWKIIPNKDLLPRYGHSITQINEDEVMLFGGFDRSDYSTSRCEIINLKIFNVKIVEPDTPSRIPSARGFHGIKNYRDGFILYGGKTGSGDNLNDMWKFLTPSQKWVKIEETKTDTEFYLYKSGFSFLSINSSDRPILYGGENRSKEQTNELIYMDFEICTSNAVANSGSACLPCGEGYSLLDKKCFACNPGTYLNINTNVYTESKCDKCPSGTFNSRSTQSDLSSCSICGFNFYNAEVGQKECKICDKDQLCLPGTSIPVKDEFLLNKISQPYQSDTNYPDFTNTNSNLQTIYRKNALIVVSIVMALMLFFLSVCYKIQKSKVTKALIYLDFIPLTGGSTKKCSGGFITLIYTILILSLSFTFVLRYLYFNELIEVIPIAYSNSEQDSLDSSLQFSVQIVGQKFSCLESEKSDKCSSDLSFAKANDPNYFSDTSKSLKCSLSKEGHCQVKFNCEDCKSISNNDVIQIAIKTPNAFVQVYHWSLESAWSENFDPLKGFSKIDGIFRPDNNIQGENPSSIDILLTPVFYSNTNTGLKLSGYRSSLKQYTRGDIKSDLNFYQTRDGVKLNLKFLYATNSYQINAKNQIEILDFYAFVLGMLAGFSFLSRISKYLCEKCGICDISAENYHELEEEKADKLEKLDEKSKQEIEIPMQNNPVKESSPKIENNSADHLNNNN